MRLEALELVHALEEGNGMVASVTRLNREHAGVFAFAVAHLGDILEPYAEFPGDEELGSGALGTGCAGNLDGEHDLRGNLRHWIDILHLAHRLNLARHADEGNALEAGIA